ncbi:MAG: glycosyltransferase family 9 protein [Candidatus Omnitrophota bacterium]|jgi:ADP-heptose:LPS heptosyltransferase
MIKNILINFPTNLGDAIMGLPVLDRLKSNYPRARITAIVSLGTREFLLENDSIDEVVVFNKHWTNIQKIRFVFSLRKKYDLMTDLKNSFLPVLLGVREHTHFFRKFPQDMHLKDRYLSLVEPLAPEAARFHSQFTITGEKEQNWRNKKITKAIFIACSSRNRFKRYPVDLLHKALEEIKSPFPIAILGQKEERKFYSNLFSIPGALDLVGKTSMSEVYFLLKEYGRLLISADSGLLHLGSYLDLPILALFGPTDPCRYGPWSKRNIVLRPQSQNLADISPQEVAASVKRLLSNEEA